MVFEVVNVRVREYQTTSVPFVEAVWPSVSLLALRSGDPGFKTRSNHSLNLFLVDPGSTSRLHL